MAKDIKQKTTDTDRKTVGGSQYFNLEAEKAFFDEVDEEVRNEKFKQLINKYGGVILIVLIAALSFAVGYERVAQWQTQKAEQRNVRYVQALAPNADYENNVSELENIVATESGLYKDIARLQIANILLDNNQKTRGLEVLENLYQDSEATDKVREIAAIKLASYKIDSASYQEIETLLMPITSNANSAWILMAKELLAMSAIQNMDMEKGRAIYQDLLANGNISNEFKSRINDMLASINEVQK